MLAQFDVYILLELPKGTAPWLLTAIFPLENLGL
jgi:hypothetical protein